MLMYSPLIAYFDDVVPQQPALSNDGKQQQPALGDYFSYRARGFCRFVRLQSTHFRH
jgi:hypothetical protein